MYACTIYSSRKKQLPACKKNSRNNSLLVKNSLKQITQRDQNKSIHKQDQNTSIFTVLLKGQNSVQVSQT